MARSLYAFTLIALAVSFTTPATARDEFKRGSTAYTVGMYNSAARQWLTLAEGGNRAAQYSIGRLFYYGRGVRRDRIEAYKWFFIASKNGVRRGDDAMRIAERHMTPSEIGEARIRAREWYRRNSS
ncbi:MAG: hypothetical protein ACPGRZ_16645 [Alphaproteobacteria bacterium]